MISHTFLSMAAFSEDPDTLYRRLKQEGEPPLNVDQLIMKWDELRSMIDDEDLTMNELIDMCPQNKELNREDFMTLHEQIEALFEDDEDEDEEDDSSINSQSNLDIETTMSVKQILLAYFDDLRSSSSTGNRLPCGFDCEDRERDLIQKGIDALEKESENLIFRNGGKLKSNDIMGNWNLLYTSSRTMIINKSLSGLGRSTSDKAIFRGIQMRLTGNKFLGQVEFVETFSGDDDDVSLDVLVVGEWMLEDGRNIFTGAPSSSLRVNPETITYGLSKNKAEEWASLGPIKLLDILYCDSNLLLLRGTANTDAHFIYQRETFSSNK